MEFKPFKIDRYLLLEKIATGGMAEVYRAKARGAGGFEKQLAVKRILPNYSSNEEFRRMFEYEARLSSMLTHANIVQIYDFVKSGETYLLAMEYVNGKNLRQLVNKARKLNYVLPIEFSIYTINEVCKGLDYAHQKREELSGRPLNIIHRDMSPQNIMLSYDGAVKIVDFGIAKAKDRVDETRSGVIKGKFGYMSPEQANGLNVDHRTDIFSTAIILYEMLTGKRLFSAENDMQTLKFIQECIIPPPTKANPRISLELERILLKGLVKDVAHRYQTAGQFHRSLQEYLNKYFPKFHQPETAEVVQRIFADDIEAEKRRFEQIHRQSIPYSQGDVPQAATEHPKDLEQALEGDQTRSEFEADTAVTDVGGEDKPEEPGRFVPKELTFSSVHSKAEAGDTRDQKTLVEDISQSMGPAETGVSDKTLRSEKSFNEPVTGSFEHVTPTAERMAILKEGSLREADDNRPRTDPTAVSNAAMKSLTESPVSRSSTMNNTSTPSSQTSSARRDPVSLGGLGTEPKFEIEQRVDRKRPQYTRERDYYPTKKKSSMVPYLISLLGLGITALLYKVLYMGKVNGVPPMVEMIPPERPITQVVPKPKPFVIPKAAGECLLKLDSDPTGAEVTVDGLKKGVTTATVSVPCNKGVNVTFSKSGFESSTENIYINNSEEKFLKSLKKIPTGTLQLTLTRNAKLYMGDDLIGEAIANQPFAITLRAGQKHTIRFVNELYKIQFSETFVVKEGYITPRTIRLEGTPAKRPR